MDHEKVITYTSQQLKPYEKNYLTHDLEWALINFTLKFGDTICTMKKVKFSLTYKSLKYFFHSK